MKNLKKLNLKSDSLTRGEMRVIQGSYGSSDCSHNKLYCPNNLYPCEEYVDGEWLCTQCCMG